MNDYLVITFFMFVYMIPAVPTSAYVAVLAAERKPRKKESVRFIFCSAWVGAWWPISVPMLIHMERKGIK